jgi:bifunctional UDP-N-acetylglucosamine pyrophosphorylase / glucosamine-1-phosphate N-acetyltransferase
VTQLTVIVLAAGGGTRMKSATNKVLHQIGGRSLVGHVLHSLCDLKPDRVVAVVGTQADQVAEHVQSLDSSVEIAVQPIAQPGGPPVPYGTGFALQIGINAMEQTPTGTVIMVFGDTPLLRPETLQALLLGHEQTQSAVTVLSSNLGSPTGYGRIVRDTEGAVTAIVEERDATPEQRKITEINSGIMAFEATFLLSALPQLTDNNAQGEVYVTDLVALAVASGQRVSAHLSQDATETEGVNDRRQLAALGHQLNERILRHWMLAGVTVLDPRSTWVDADVQLAPDVTLLPGTQVLGRSTVAEGATIGPDSTLVDCVVAEQATVVRSHALGAQIGPRATIGPFSYLRPGAQVAESAKVGAFVEVKNSHIGVGAKVPHLSYIGDAEIGEGANVGAGTIVANYDGVNKHRTTVGRHARTGSNNTFVAPVEIGDGAATGAGAVIRRNVPPGALAVTGGAQRNLDNWVAQRRAGTAQAQAAVAAKSKEANKID